MLRRRRSLTTVVLAVLVVVGATACPAPTVPIGARAAGANVEAFVGSCSDVAIDLELYETAVPVPTTTRPPRSTPDDGSVGGGSPRGTTWSKGTSVWEGTVPVGQQSMVIPVALDPGLTYTITAHGTGDPHFDDYTFVPDDLSAEGVVPYGSWNQPGTPEQFAERFDAACDDAAGGPIRWIFYGVLLVALLLVVALIVGFALLIRAGTRRRPGPPMAPPPTWG